MNIAGEKISRQQGSMATTKGYTGQFADAQTGLDYYNARYYDPRVGVFLSADTVQGNAQGMDPYSYGGSNPETLGDPSRGPPQDFPNEGVYMMQSLLQDILQPAAAVSLSPMIQ